MKNSMFKYDKCIDEYAVVRAKITKKRAKHLDQLANSCIHLDRSLD